MVSTSLQWPPSPFMMAATTLVLIFHSRREWSCTQLQLRHEHTLDPLLSLIHPRSLAQVQGCLSTAATHLLPKCTHAFRCCNDSCDGSRLSPRRLSIGENSAVQEADTTSSMCLSRSMCVYYFRGIPACVISVKTSRAGRSAFVEDTPDK